MNVNWISGFCVLLARNYNFNVNTADAHDEFQVTSRVCIPYPYNNNLLLLLFTRYIKILRHIILRIEVHWGRRFETDKCRVSFECRVRFRMLNFRRGDKLKKKTYKYTQQGRLFSAFRRDRIMYFFSKRLRN